MYMTLGQACGGQVVEQLCEEVRLALEQRAHREHFLYARVRRCSVRGDAHADLISDDVSEQ